MKKRLICLAALAMMAATFVFSGCTTYTEISETVTNSDGSVTTTTTKTTNNEDGTTTKKTTVETVSESSEG
jgi:ABC-type glycerol-3-phosphate transport system substrate-binding protein